jgi:glycosyltransferase involved in cell wall biosynthesis
MKAPLVLIDADVIGRRRTGDESYVENLLRELGRASDGLRFGAVTRHPERLPAGIEPFHLPARSQPLRMFARFPMLTRRLRPALTHLQYVIPPGVAGPTVVTVHDISFALSRSYAPIYDLLAMRALVPRSMKRAERVFTVSEWSKREIAERYRIDPAKIVVTPNGVDPRYTTEGPTEDGSPYLLFVGAIQARKDPVAAVDALASLGGDLRLVFAGPDKGDAGAVRERAAERGVAGRIELRGYVTNEALAALYRGAACLVFPSRYEGFGLPILEAMASGTPVVATASTCIPEVAGDAAVLVVPGDGEALADGIRRALDDRDRLRAAGLARAARFDWAETARRTLEVYRELV